MLRAMGMQLQWCSTVLFLARCQGAIHGSINVQVDCEIGEVNAEGLRGVRAQRDMQQHQVAVKLPKVMAITLKEWNKTSEVRACPPRRLYQMHCTGRASARSAHSAWSS